MRPTDWTLRLFPLTGILFLVTACGGDTTPATSGDPITTVVPTTVAPTAPPTVVTTPTSAPTTVPVATTLAGGGWAEKPVITSPWGVLGWWEESEWIDARDYPDIDLTGRYRLVGLTGSDGAEVDSVGETCHEDAGGVVRLPELSWGEGSPFPVWSVAVSAPWALGEVETVDQASAEYVDYVRDFLSDRGLEVEDPRIIQTIQADLHGDAVLDLILVTEAIAQPVSLQPTAGDYSVVLVVEDGDLEDEIWVVGGEALVLDPERGEIPFMLRVPAVADFNGDGTLEIVVAHAYYEGQGVSLFDFVEGRRGPVQVLSAGCGV